MTGSCFLWAHIQAIAPNLTGLAYIAWNSNLMLAIMTLKHISQIKISRDHWLCKYKNFDTVETLRASLRPLVQTLQNLKHLNNSRHCVPCVSPLRFPGWTSQGHLLDNLQYLLQACQPHIICNQLTGSHLSGEKAHCLIMLFAGIHVEIVVVRLLSVMTFNLAFGDQAYCFDTIEYLITPPCQCRDSGRGSRSVLGECRLCNTVPYR